MPTKTALEFELLALRLYVHGPEGMDFRVAMRLLRGPLWLETRNLLRGNGFELSEIASLAGRAHPKGCACWECVKALNRAVRRATNKRKLRLSPMDCPPAPEGQT